MVNLKIPYWCFLGIFLAAWSTKLNGQLDSSYLPILEIRTQRPIVDNPKVEGGLFVYDNRDGKVNRTTDRPLLYHRIGVDIRGQSSKALYDKKGFGIEIWDQNNEDVAISILDLPAESDWVIHSPYGDKSLMRNALIYRLGETLFDYAPRTRLCELVLNGDYYGVCLFTEKIKVDKNRVAIAKISPDDNTANEISGGYILKFDKGSDEEVVYESPHNPRAGNHEEREILLHDPDIEQLTQKQFDYIRSYLEFFEDVLIDTNFADPSRGFQPLIDVESFVRYFLINELSRNVDAYRLSTYFYKRRNDRGGKLVAGPIWDYNLAFGNADYCDGFQTVGWAWEFDKVCPNDQHGIHFWWSRFLQDEDFADQLIREYWRLRGYQFSERHLMNMIDSMASHLGEAQDRNFQRWNVLGKDIWPNYFVGETYQEEVDYLKDWIVRRLAWLDDNIEIISERSFDGYYKVLSYNLYPNPSTGHVNLDVITEGKTKMTVRVFNAFGGLVHEIENDDIRSFNHHLEWNTNTTTPGIYFVQIVSDGEAASNVRLAIIH